MTNLPPNSSPAEDGGRGDQPYGSYPVAHPEDQWPADAEYGSFDGGYPSAAPGSSYGFWGKYPLAIGDGFAAIFESIKFGFTAVFKSWYVWVVSAIIALLLYTGAVVGFIFYLSKNINSDGTFKYDFVVGDGALAALFIGGFLLFAAIAPFFTVGGLRQTEKEKISWKDLFTDVNWPAVFAAYLLVSVFNMLLGSIPTALALLLPGDAAGYGLGLIINVATIFLSPFYSFIPCYVADKRGSFSRCIAMNFEDAKRNYLRLLGGLILLGIIASVGSFAFGVGLVITAPAAFLATFHIYRKMSGGLYPVVDM